MDKHAPLVNFPAPGILAHLRIDVNVHADLSSIETATKRECEASSVHGNFRNGHNKAPTPLPDKLQLLHDLVFQVPGEDDYIVRLRLSNPVGMMDWNMTARQEASLLIRASVHGVFDQVLADSAVMQQGS